MKLIKLPDNHFIVVDESEINRGDYFIDLKRESYRKPYLCDIGTTNAFILTKEINFPIEGCFKITHSNIPLESVLPNEIMGKIYKNVKPLSLSEVEEAIYGYSVEKIAKNQWGNVHRAGLLGYMEGFKAHQELTKDKLFTIRDMIAAFIEGTNSGAEYDNLAENDLEEAENFSENEMNNFIQSLLPKTEWDIEIDKQGKIKLL